MTFRTPPSAQRAAALLGGRGGQLTCLEWNDGEPSAGECERREMVDGIAARMAYLDAVPASDPAERELCLRLLDHLASASAPCELTLQRGLLVDPKRPLAAGADDLALELELAVHDAVQRTRHRIVECQHVAFL